MTTPNDASGARAHYARRRDDARSVADGLGGRASAISLARVVVFLAFCGFGLAGRFAGWGQRGYTLSIAALVVFVVLMVLHDGVLERKKRADAAVAWANEGLERLDGKFAHDPRPGEPSPVDGHPYAGDLDVLGKGGLLQSIDTTRTAQGRALLASWLLAPAEAEEVRARQSAARDLASQPALLEALSIEGSIVAEEPPDPTPLLKWAREGTGLSQSPLVSVLTLLLPIATLFLLFGGGALPLPRALWAFLLLAQLAVRMRLRSGVQPAIEAASEHSGALTRVARMLQVIEQARFSDPALEALRARVAQGPASKEIAQLGRIVGFVDARRNEVFRFMISPLLLWDENCAFALERWRRRAGTRMPAHLEDLFRVEALAALGTRAFEHPEDAWPEIAADIRLDARGLAHPLIGEGRAVRNDVSFDRAGAVLLVTGSNMSGKSTLMRAIGTNVVLALAGANVRAHALTTAPFQVWTSMRVRDDLHAGISHFLAELKRLKAVVDAADAATNARPVLFLLDEILHGTNSRERHLGAQAIVRHLVQRLGCGAVSTHDLALASLEGELAGRVRNVHFREQIETVDGVETMTFDYVLRAGVVTSSNALRLMRMVGLDVDLNAKEAPLPVENAE